MNEICIEKDVKDALYVGIQFQYIKGFTLKKARKLWKQPVEEECKKHGWDGKPPFPRITMPCGESVTYQTFEDIPMVDVPCSCGNPRHWFIKYVKVE